jgi:hypothetical protein
MAHPYYHSLSSVQQWGGAWQDYIQIHTWIDGSKQFLADFRHRSLRHHKEGTLLASLLFGATITTSDNQTVSTSKIAERHIVEDLGFLPSHSKWLLHVEVDDLQNNTKVVTTEEQTLRSVAKWGGVAEDYLRVHELLDECLDIDCPQRRLLARHHSEGIFLAETICGTLVMNSHNKPIPTRIIAEMHIAQEFDYIPLVSNIMKTIKPKSWMMKVAEPSRVILSRE